MTEMQGSELARYRIDDMLRAAEAERLSKATRAGRAAARRTAGRRFAQALMFVLRWPIHHA